MRAVCFNVSTFLFLLEGGGGVYGSQAFHLCLRRGGEMRAAWL